MPVPDLPSFTKLLGVNVLHRSPERTEAELPVRAELCNRRFTEVWGGLKDFNYSRDEWAALVDRTFAGIAETPPSASFFGTLYDHFAQPKAWRVFDDVFPALDALASGGFKLGIISNTDDNLFLATAKLLKVPFDEIVTAQQSRSYKPSLRNFQLAIERMGVPNQEILHVAQSIYHDVVPSRTLGIASAWVNRGSARKGAGATKIAFAAPDLEVPDLQSLALMAS